MEKTPLLEFKQRMKARAVANLEQYYDTYRKPMLASLLLRGFAPQCIRYGTSVTDILNEMHNEKLLTVIYSPGNKRYVVPNSSITDEDSIGDFIHLVDEEERAERRASRRERYAAKK